MGGLGSGKAITSPTLAELDKARMELGRELARANREGETFCRVHKDALRIVLLETLTVLAENRRLKSGTEGRRA